MTAPNLGDRSQSGVFQFRDFRDNLIIDRYDPVFAGMRGSKLESLRSENSEDAVTWNVFRSLRQIGPEVWFPELFARSFAGSHLPDFGQPSVRLWETIAPPPSLRRVQKDEGDSEIDVLIESDSVVWFIEAKYRSDISVKTTNNPGRDQILRNLDVGTYYAGVRAFYFSLLVLSQDRSPDGVAAVRKYQAGSDVVRDRLRHRPDGLPNLKGMGVLTWSDLASSLALCAEAAPRPDERAYASRAVEWLQGKKIHPEQRTDGG